VLGQSRKLLRKAQAREALDTAITHALATRTVADAYHGFDHCGDAL
jgi:hypothetical protein